MIELFKTGDQRLNKLPRLLFFMLIVTCLCGAAFVFADELKSIQLPPPQTEIGKPLMQVLHQRQSARDFGFQGAAAAGTRQPSLGSRWHQSTGLRQTNCALAMNWQEVDVYVALPEALYLYEAKTQTLAPVVGKDLREATGKQSFVKDAPLNLVYVVDLARMKNASEDDKRLYSSTDVGFVAQNAYLYCASQGLAVVVPRFD